MNHYFLVLLENIFSKSIGLDVFLASCNARSAPVLNPTNDLGGEFYWNNYGVELPQESYRH
jgi:hypothetical protein